MNIGNDLNLAAQMIREGKLVAFPTETVYGLGANAFDPYAVAAVFEAKKRPSFDPLIVHVASIEQMEALFEMPIHPIVKRLADSFWPGPLTLVHPKRSSVPDLVTSGLSTVAVRMPSHPVALELIRLAGVPIAAPSANRFGCLSPTTAAHVAKQLPGIDYVIDGGSASVGIESTVVAVRDNGVVILRNGVITRNDLAAVVTVFESDGERSELNLPAPGMLKSHYSPSKPLYLMTPGMVIPEGAGIIVRENAQKSRFLQHITVALSEQGDMAEMAVNLFACMHYMEDHPNVTHIYIEPVDAQGIGMAIMDRVSKAAYRYIGESGE
ncbi:MAG: threonylcarbamoyl-AMP synthase [Marinilabiliaceae bacterium]|nr:threonylcarbamoyl-AMP synthase [Marinilabiliaceae bacterium]